MSRRNFPLAGLAGVFVGAAIAGTWRRGRRGASGSEDDLRTEHDWAPPPSLTAEERREIAVLDILATRPTPQVFDPGTPVTDLLLARLEDGDEAAIANRLTGTLLDVWAAADQTARRRLTLNFAAAVGPEAALNRTGLVNAMPPEDVHAMARSQLAAGGSPFLADLVASALHRAGLELRPGATVLDFGCSSGRVLRVIAAARPDLSCLGCDPNEGAIAWASAHLPGQYFVSPIQPPLPLDSGSVDVVYAISIWSHFAAEPAIVWLQEVRRVLTPGGALVMTTHSWDTLATGLRRGTVGNATLAEATAALIAEGHFFVDVFGDQGDWGVKDPGWGNAYLTLDWLMSHATNDWAARLLLPGFLDHNQDLIVLQRR